MLRSLAAVLAGVVVVTVLALGADAALSSAVPGAFNADGYVEGANLLLVVIAYVAIFIVMGAYTSARVARSRPMLHALVLGAIVLVFTLAATLRLWDTAPAWYHVVQLLLVPPCAWFGGRMREREIARYAPHGRIIPTH